MFGHILRLEEHRVIRKVLMNCVRPTPADSLFGDVPDLDSRKAAEIAKDREKWKSLMGRCSKKILSRPINFATRHHTPLPLQNGEL